MKQTGFLLKTDADFDNAVWLGQHLELWQQGELVHAGGIAEYNTAFWVRINGSAYFKSAYEFWVR
ncbi:hypothetical protein [Gorillibacterium timonense]|uniref:hypothetical protein n=1 Tax=Gorillibacterium timonense TaxID=1689269 RepID=UPI00071C65D4|nr:hypothetical protein [Gorillibacterium timonense]